MTFTLFRLRLALVLAALALFLQCFGFASAFVAVPTTTQPQAARLQPQLSQYDSFVAAMTRSRTTTSTRLYFFGQPKDDGSPGDYLCPDCGYVFTKGPKEWAKLPDNWSCPPCGAIKRRFKKVPKNGK